MKILLAGGGTAGHINPAISIADEFKKRDASCRFLFIGKKGNMEERLVTKSGYDIDFIDIEGFKRDKKLKNIIVVLRTIRAIGQAKKIIKRFSPDAVVCTGGYISGPVMCAAHALKIPCLIHESNVYPGVAVKMSEKYATKIAICFEKTKGLLKHPEKCVMTGNPVRASILSVSKSEARKRLSLDEKPFILAFGGSLGAKKLNETVVNCIKLMPKGEYNMLFGTGNRNYDEVTKMLADMNIDIGESKNISVVPYIYNMDEAMNAADIVVSRAGAISISEIMALGKPSILIPSPNVAYNHQETNARALENNGAACVICEKDLSAEALKNKFDELLSDKEVLKQMSENAKKMAVSDANVRLYNEISEMVSR